MRTARVAAEMQRILAEAIEKSYEPDTDNDVATITEVVVDPDLRRARVYFDHLSEVLAVWLGRNRVKLQSAIAHQMRIKRTPLLEFAVDPSIAEGAHIDSILRSLNSPSERY